VIRGLVAVTALAIASAHGQTQTEATSDWESKIWLSGQLNVVTQSHPSFPSPYSGPNSFTSNAQTAVTGVVTLYTGYSLVHNTEFFFDLESAKGAGVSGALGLGGLENLDAVTDKTATAAPYVARLQVRQIIPFSKHMVDATRNPLGLAAKVPDHRLELRLGKMSLTDFFDLNEVGSDSHLQFLNYAIDNNATYDIAANSRGYTYAALAELYTPGWTMRFAEAFADVSGLGTDWDLAHNHAENFEFEIHPDIGGQQPFVLRALGFVNHAQMGSYPEAVTAFLNGHDPRPDLNNHLELTTNWGVGLNGEATIPKGIRLFGRFGWNEGTKEAFQFAEADRTVVLGGDFDGRFWKAPKHRVGVAMAVNAITAVHRQYLELGGDSFLLGDGALTYGHEKILEAYYNVSFGHGIFGAFDVQRIWNPGYNHARGPVIIFGFRLHAETDVHFN
jgi:hypothetical protein